MAKRFFCPFYDEREIRYDIEIWDSSFSGTALEFRAGPEGYDVRYAQNAERTAVFMPTECVIRMQMQSDDHFALVTDLQGAAEGRFTVKITKGDTPVLAWAGMVLPDIGRYNEEAYPTEFEIRATDGVGLLKDVEYKDTSSAYTGKARLIEHIALCLSRLPYVDTHYGGSDIFIKTHVDWWEETMADSASDSDALYQAYIDHAVWWKYDKGEQKFLSCYDVLKNILTVLGCRITNAEGAFWIEQLTYRAAATIVTRRYTKTGGFLSTANYAGYNDINQTNSGALLAVGTYEFFPALTKAVHVFKSVERRNFLSGANIDQTTPTQTMYFPLKSNSGNTTMRLTGSLTGQVLNLTSTPINVPVVVVFKIRLILDTVALKRSYFLKPTYQVEYSALSWESGTQVCYMAVTMNGGIPPNSSPAVATFTQKIDLELPQLPEDVTQFIFGVEFDSFRKFDGTPFTASNYAFSWKVGDPWIEVYSDGNPVLTADETLYETYNTIQTTNSVIHETESLIGSSTDPNTIGSIWVKPSSTYVLADDWGEGTDTPDREVEKLLTEFVLSGQHAPLRRLQGTLFGDIVAMRRVLWDGVYWMLLGGSYRAGSNEFSGEWVEINYAPGLSASPPRRRKLTLIDPPVPPNPNTGLNGAKGIYEIASKPPGTLLYPVATSTTSGEELAGAKTSIGVTVPLVDGEYQVGDTITILNPILGHFEDLTVGTTSVDTDTAIDVSGTLLLDYPENSPIIKKPIPGSFGLPAGQTGQIFWHNGTRWQPYGDSSMAEGVVLTWNDATGWTAQAPTGGVTGTGTTNVLPKWTSGTALGDSAVTDAGSTVTIAKTGYSDGTEIFRIRDGSVNILALMPRPLYSITEVMLGTPGSTANNWVRIWGDTQGSTLNRMDFEVNSVFFKSAYYSGDLWMTRTGDATSGTQYPSGIYRFQSSLWNGSSAESRVFYFVSEPSASGVARLALYREPLGGGAVIGTCLMSNTGYFGIGTNNPLAPLVVAKSTGDHILLGESEIKLLGAGIANNSIINNAGGVKGLFIGSTDSGDTLGNPFTAYLKVGGTSESEFFQLLKLTQVQITTGAANGRVLQSNAAGVGSWVDQWVKDGGVVSGLWTDVTRVTVGGTSGSELVLRNADSGTSQASNDAYDVLILRPHAATDNNWAAMAGYSAGGAIAADIAFRFVDHTNHFADIVFSTRNGVGYTHRMWIKSSGSIGVGTDSPAQTFHVAGTARITGSSGTATTILGRNASGDLSVYTIVVADIPNLPASIITSGILPMARGGTGTGTAGTPGHLARMNGAGDALEFFASPYLTGNQTITLSGDVTGSGATSIATTIANNVVSMAKIQQVATATFLGRNTAGTGNVEILSTSTVRTMLGYLLGSLTAFRIPFSIGGNDLGDDDMLTWNPTTNRLSVGNTGGSPAASVHIAEGSVVSWEPLRAAGTVSGNMITSFLNSSNAGGVANNIIDLSVGGASAGDPMYRWLINGVSTWSFGLDNSDGDKLKLKKAATPSTGTNLGLVMTADATPLFGINKDSPAHPLDVEGRARATMLVALNGTFGTTFGTGAGSSPLLTQLQGSSNGFVLAFKTGTTPTANANVITVNLPLGFPSAMYPTFSAGNAQTATDITKFYIDSAGTSVLVLRANGTLSAATDFKFYFNISGI